MAAKLTSWFKSFLKNTATKIVNKIESGLMSYGDYLYYLEKKYGSDAAVALVSLTAAGVIASIAVAGVSINSKIKTNAMIKKIRSGELKEKDLVQMLSREIVRYLNSYNYDPLNQIMVNNTITKILECKTFAQLKQYFNSDEINYIERLYNENKPDAKSRIDSITFTNNMIMLPRKRRSHKDGPALKRIGGLIKRDPEVIRLKKFWENIGNVAEELGDKMWDSVNPSFDPQRINREIPSWINDVRFIINKLGQVKINDSKQNLKRRVDLFGINSAKKDLEKDICKRIVNTVEDFFKPFQVFATFCPRKATETCNRTISSLQEIKKLVEQYLERYAKKDSKYAIARVKYNRMLKDFGRESYGRAIVGRTSGAIGRVSGFVNGIKQKISNKFIPQLKQYADSFKKLPGGQKMKALMFSLIYVLARFKQAKTIREAIDIAKKAKKNIEDIQYNVNEITIENGEVVPNEVQKEAYIARNIAIFMKGLKFLVLQVISVLSKAAVMNRLENPEGSSEGRANREFDY